MQIDIFKKFKKAFRPRKLQSGCIVVTEDEVSLTTKKGEAWHFTWNEITKIEAYKLDIFTMDLVCLDISVEPRKVVIKINEDMKGFREFGESMCRRFQSIDANWLPQIASPPFARNHRVLYERHLQAPV